MQEARATKHRREAWVLSECKLTTMACRKPGDSRHRDRAHGASSMTGHRATFVLGSA